MPIVEHPVPPLRGSAGERATPPVSRIGSTRIIQPAIEAGALAEMPDAKAEQSFAEWKRRIQGFDEVDTLFDAEDGILWCYMNPKDRPSVTLGLARESFALQRSVSELFAAQPANGPRPVRYMVWGSRHAGVFNLGGDLRLFAHLIREQDSAALLDYATACIDVVYANATGIDLPIVTISLVQGDALGGGFEAALSSNVVVAERSAKFGLPEVLFSLFPGMGAYSLIARRIGGAQAERMIFSGKVYTAEELHEIGLVDLLADDGQGEDVVYDFVARNGRRHAAQCAVYRAGRRVNPLTYEELYDIAVLWVEAALTLTEADLRKMERLAAAQDRRRASQ